MASYGWLEAPRFARPGFELLKGEAVTLGGGVATLTLQVAVGPIRDPAVVKRRLAMTASGSYLHASGGGGLADCGKGDGVGRGMGCDGMRGLVAGPW